MSAKFLRAYPGQAVFVDCSYRDETTEAWVAHALVMIVPEGVPEWQALSDFAQEHKRYVSFAVQAWPAIPPEVPRPN